MQKYNRYSWIVFISLLLLFSIESQAFLAPEKFDSTYCVVPIIGAPTAHPRQRGGVDFFYTYPIPPYLLVNDNVGSLWTIKGFNEASVYTPEIQLTYFDASIYSIENRTVYIFEPHSLKHSTSYHKPYYKLQGNNYPEIIEKDEIAKLGNTEKILRDQYRQQKNTITLKDDLYVAARNSGIYLVHPSGKALPILGNQLLRSMRIELYPMTGRGDLLVNTLNGLFILSENKGETTGHCNQVKLIHKHNYILTPLLTSIYDDVIFGAIKIGEDKYLINTQSRKLWVYDRGRTKIISNLDNAVKIISLGQQNLLTDVDVKPIVIGSYKLLIEDKFYSVAVKGRSTDQFYGEAISEIPNTNSFLLEGVASNGLSNLAIRNPNLEIKTIDEPKSWEMGVTDISKKNIRYLFENGFYTIADRKILIKKFPHVDSWQRGWIAYIHPDKQNPKNTIMFEGSRGGAFKIDANGELEKFNSFPIADTQQISNYCSDNEILYFIYQNKVMKWSEKEGLTELAQLDVKKHGTPNSLMLLGENLIFAGNQGAFKINKNSSITTYISDSYRVGPIQKIEPLPNHQAYLVFATYGLFIINKDEVISRLHLEGRENEYFSGQLVYDGIESYINTQSGIYRIDTRE